MARYEYIRLTPHCFEDVPFGLYRFVPRGEACLVWAAGRVGTDGASIFCNILTPGSEKPRFLQYPQTKFHNACCARAAELSLPPSSQPLSSAGGLEPE